MFLPEYYCIRYLVHIDENCIGNEGFRHNILERIARIPQDERL